MAVGRINSINSTFTVDCVVFGFKDDKLNVLLIKRGEDPYRGFYAIPGDFARLGETIDDSANRVLKELTGLDNIYQEQFNAIATPNRHPWGKILTIPFFALIKVEEKYLDPSSFAEAAAWCEITNVPNLGFDHNAIIEQAKTQLQKEIVFKPIGFELLPKKFTLAQLQNLYESILDFKIDKRNFRRKFLKTELLIPLDEKQKNVAHKAARFYKFDSKLYKALKEKGFPTKIV